MIVTWTLRFIDRTSKSWATRHLLLDTAKLESSLRAAVELAVLSQHGNYDREMVKYRRHFNEITPELLHNHLLGVGYENVKLIEYFEDQDGNEVSLDDIAIIRSGSMHARMVPPGAKQHDINFMFSDRTPLPVGEVTLSPELISIFGQFAKDNRELTETAFFQLGPGKLGLVGSMSRGEYKSANVTTSATDDEIRSYVTIFRRLYMKKEPANFKVTASAFIALFNNNPYANWVAAIADGVQQRLDSPFEQWPFIQKGRCTFSAKRLIDVYLYTQFAHQPNETRLRQYKECLAELNGSSSFLFWLFLTCVWQIGKEIKQAGDVIAGWFDSYCEHHGVSHDTLRSLKEEHPGIGADEKYEERRKRLFEEKAMELAHSIWSERNRPEGGHWQFLDEARDRIREASE